MAATGRLAEMRQAILSAATAPELQGRLQALQGPALSPADMATPIPVLRERLLSSLRQAEQGVSDQLQGPGVTGIWELVRRSLRVMLTAAGYAIGLAALAQRLGTHMSRLQEWQIGLSFREKLRERRRASHSLR